MAETALEPSPLEAAVPVAELSPATRPGWYYGWAMLPLSMAALIASSPGQTFGISVFNEPMRASLQLSHGQLAMAYTLGTLLGAVPIMAIGRMMDRRGMRAMMLGSLTLFCGACLLTSLVFNWFTLLVCFVMLRMLGPGVLAFASGNTLAYWFERRLGMVEGVRQLGLALAMAVIPALNLWLVTNWGWRGAYALLGVTIWLLLFPLFYLFYRNRPEDLGQRIDGHAPPAPVSDGAPRENVLELGLSVRETLRTSAFWIALVGTALFSLIHTAVFFCLLPIFHENGLTDADAARTLMVFAGCLAVAQLVGGSLADRVPARWLMAPGMASLALAMFLLRAAQTPALALVAGSAMGIAQGIYFGAMHPLWARYFGRLHLGQIRGILMTVNVAAASIGPLIAGVTRDLSGSFQWALLVFAIMPLPLILLSLAVRPPRPAHRT